MFERYVKVSWKIDTKTGEAKDVKISKRASAMEETTAACLMVRHAFETIAPSCGKEKARKCLLDTVTLALDVTEEEIEAHDKARGVVTQQ